MKTFSILVAVLLLLIVIVGGGALFTVSQTEQAIVCVSANLSRDAASSPSPACISRFPSSRTWCSSTIAFSRRRVRTRSARLRQSAARVDSFVRYKIVDPLRFYQTVGGILGANNQLASVLNSAVRRVLSEANQQQIVRDERAALIVKIRQQANLEAHKFGVEIVDARIRRVDLPQQISEKVFGRMQTERAREAAEYRAQGSEQAQKITAKADRDVIVLKAEAQRQADQIKGEETPSGTEFSPKHSVRIRIFSLFTARCRLMK